MSYSQAQLVLLIEYIERQVDTKMKKLGLSKQFRQQVLLEIEKIKQTIIEYGLEQIQRELGIP